VRKLALLNRFKLSILRLGRNGNDHEPGVASG